VQSGRSSSAAFRPDASVVFSDCTSDGLASFTARIIAARMQRQKMRTILDNNRAPP
jgi:hypothetical protein